MWAAPASYMRVLGCSGAVENTLKPPSREAAELEATMARRDSDDARDEAGLVSDAGNVGTRNAERIVAPMNGAIHHIIGRKVSVCVVNSTEPLTQSPPYTV